MNKISLADATQSTGTWTTTAPSYEFDGTDDYIDLGAGNILDFGTGDFTISAWVKYNYIPNEYYTIYSKGGWGLGEIQFRLQKNTYELLTVIDRDGSGDFLTGNTQLNENIWYYVTTKRESGIVYLYINGELDNNKTIGGNISNSYNAEIGMRNDINGDYFNGSISNVKIWDRMLSDEEISYLYNKEKVNYK
jgi:hypothetical protein